MIFSVVIPVYNVEKYLDQCISSVIKQRKDDIEIILVDDGSTDGSGCICDAYAEKYAYIKVMHKENEGLLMARRDGFRLSQGDYVLSLDSDDYYFDGAFDRFREIIQSKLPDIILLNLTFVRDGKKIGKLNKRTPFESNSFLKKEDLYNWILLKSCNLGSMAAKCVKRNCIDIENGYDEFKGQNYCEDSLQSVAIYTRAKSVYYIDSDIYGYRLGSGMTKQTSVDYYFGMKNVYRTLLPYEEVWRVNNFQDKARGFLLKSAVEFVLVQYKSDYNRQELIEAFQKISSDDDFAECYLKSNNGGETGSLNVIEKVISRLLYKKKYNMLIVGVEMLRDLRKFGFFNH